jgi:transposase
MTEAAPQRAYSVRELFDGVRWSVRTGAAWRRLPHDLPPWSAVYQQGQRWWKAGGFVAIGEDLRAVLRVAQGRKLAPSAVVVDSRTLHSSPERGQRAGYEGAKRKRREYGA